MIEDTIEKSRLRAIELRKKNVPSEFSALVGTLEARFRKSNTMEMATALRLRDRLYGGPIIGYLAKLLVSLVRLPVRLKQIYGKLEQLEILSNKIALEARSIREDFQSLSSSTSGQIQEACMAIERLQTTNHKVVVGNEAFRNEIREKVTRCLETIPVLESKISVIQAGETGLVQPTVASPAYIVSPAFYAAFERRFRTASADLNLHFDNYSSVLKLLRDPQKDQIAVDLGCGRGEWLKILNGQGFRAIGVDINSTTNEAGRSNSLQIVESDSLHYLKTVDSNTLDLISSFHFIEHVQAGYMLQLIQEAFRTLKAGGILILETPNPENMLVGACNFYMDPTHRKPIPPAALAFMTDYFGFELVECMRFQPILPTYDGTDPFLQRVSSHFCVGQDYAIIARKPKEAKDSI